MNSSRLNNATGGRTLSKTDFLRRAEGRGDKSLAVVDDSDRRIVPRGLNSFNSQMNMKGMDPGDLNTMVQVRICR